MKIGIVAAMSLELEYVLNHLQNVEITSYKKAQFYRGRYGNEELILLSCGIGTTNAGVYTQILIDYFEPDAVINIGIAGGLSSHLKPLEVILGTSFSHHDVRVDQMLHFFPFIDSFPADEKLIKKFAPHFDEIHQGKIVSGEGFINDESEKQRIIETFNPLLVDMETSSMAHCCLINEVPFISLRGISDLADASAEVSYKANEQRAADKVGKKLLKVLKK